VDLRHILHEKDALIGTESGLARPVNIPKWFEWLDLQMATKRPFCQRKTEDGLEKGLAFLWSRKKITKKAHAGRGPETQWEIPGDTAKCDEYDWAHLQAVATHICRPALAEHSKCQRNLRRVD